MRVLLIAYACEPDRGSEPGVGWNLAIELANRHELWVLTRANNREVIEAASREGLPEIHWVYHDLPSWARWWKRGHRGVQLYYYLWQRSARRLVREIAVREGVELVHHVTFVKYWAPSAGPVAGKPFVWGPVGGGERLPAGFWRGLSWRARAFESARVVAQRIAERDPSVRRTARGADLALCTTEDTAARVRGLGAKDVRVLGEAALSRADVERLGRAAATAPDGSLRLVYLGRLVGLKGVHLAIAALARGEAVGSVLLIVGDGPERARLERLASRLEVTDRVRFAGAMSRADALSALMKADALLHPSLHDSGGWVCLEAMAAGKAVICLDWGGPGRQVSAECGMKVPVTGENEVVSGLAAAIGTLAADRDRCARLGAAGRERVARDYTWPRRADVLDALYREVATGDSGHTRPGA